MSQSVTRTFFAFDGISFPSNLLPLHLLYSPLAFMVPLLFQPLYLTHLKDYVFPLKTVPLSSGLEGRGTPSFLVCVCIQVWREGECYCTLRVFLQPQKVR